MPLMARAFTGLLTLLICGCCGSGRIDVTALNFQAIDPPGGPPPKVYSFDMQRCSWWTDAAGRVMVAMELDRGGWLGRMFRLRFQVSFALDQPPAGSARGYAVKPTTLRAVARQGATVVRFSANSGIVALYREPGGRLRGSFRLDTMRRTLDMLGTWGRPARYLFMGTFDALPDRQGAGRRILAETELGGWTREPPATQPARTRPAG